MTLQRPAPDGPAPGERITYTEPGYPGRWINATVLDTITDHQGTHVLIQRDDAHGLWGIKLEQIISVR